MPFLRTRVITDKVNYILGTLNLSQPVTLSDLDKIRGLLGVEMLKVRLDKCSGFTYYENDRYYLVINENLSHQDSQFVIAHELGHIILEHNRQPVDTVSTDIISLMEAEADIFAARLLNCNPTEKKPGQKLKYA